MFKSGWIAGLLPDIFTLIVEIAVEFQCLKLEWSKGLKVNLKRI